MADALKILGQSKPSGNTLTALYTVPAATSAVVSTLAVCNQSNTSSAKYRVSAAAAGSADAVSQYLVYDATLAPSESVFLTIGLSLATTDVLRVQSDSGSVSFGAYGVEVT
jgi:hypothetical protein